MLFAYILENTVQKTKRLKLVEVVHLLKITNVEMIYDLKPWAEL